MADAEAQLASPLAHHRDGRAPSVDGVGGGLRVDASDVAASFPRLEEGSRLGARTWHDQPLDAAAILRCPDALWVETAKGPGREGCVWKAFGIPPLVEVFTFGPDCNEPMEFRSEGGNLQDPEGVVHFAIPARRWWENIVFVERRCPQRENVAAKLSLTPETECPGSPSGKLWAGTDSATLPVWNPYAA